jgi:hypothetical protein
VAGVITTMVTFWHTAVALRSTAHTENRWVPDAAGVPFRIPSLLRLTPIGGNPTPEPSWK